MPREITGVLLAASLRPGPIALSALVVPFAWLCYSVVSVNYGAFSICITACIAFLLAFTGLPEGEVAYHRVANTTLGGTFALLATLLYRRVAGVFGCHLAPVCDLFSSVVK